MNLFKIGLHSEVQLCPYVNDMQNFISIHFYFLLIINLRFENVERY